MKTQIKTQKAGSLLAGLRKLTLAALGGALLQAPVRADTQWNSASSGLWADSTWTAGVPSGNTALVLGNNVTVTIDGATPPANLTINQLFVGASTLRLSGNTTPLSLTGDLWLGEGGGTGELLLDGGNLVTTSSTAWISYWSGTGLATVLNGTWTARNLYLGYFTPGNINISGGTVEFATTQASYVGLYSQGNILMTGGQLVTTAGEFSLGQFEGGVGRMTLLGGTWLGGIVYVGNGDGASGFLSIVGGTNIVSTRLTVGNGTGSKGTVLLDGGRLVTTAIDYYFLGALGEGTMTVSNGTWLSNNAYVGTYNGGKGTLNIDGGNNQMSQHLLIALSPGSMGRVAMTGGRLAVTNSTGYANISVGYQASGVMTVSGGSLLANRLDVGVYYATAGGIGELYISGGTNVVSGQQYDGFTIGDSGNATGIVVITGGTLDVPNQGTFLGHHGIGTLIVSNGTLAVRETYLGVQAGSAGTLNIAGGLSWFSGNISVAHAAGAGGTVTVTDGTLAATNVNGWGGMVVGNAGVGSLTLSGGETIMDALTVANGANSIFTFNGGTLNTKATSVNNGQACVVGDGIASATLNLLNGTHAFANGLAINTNGALRIAGTNAIGSATITASMTLRSGSRLEWAFAGKQTDAATVSGSLTLEGPVTVALTSLGVEDRDTIPLITAAGGIVGSTANWPQSRVNGQRYEAIVSGNTLLMRKAPNGTTMIIR